MKPIIVYFSYTNNTRKIAKEIEQKLNCDILEIKTTVPYSNDYEEVVNNEQNSERSNYLPEIEPIDVEFNQYDTIILGTPVWWYRPVPAIRTFLSQYDLRNKTIIPFACNCGWLGKTFEEIKKMCPNSKIEKEMNIEFESYSDRLKTSQEEVETWISNIKESDNI